MTWLDRKTKGWLMDVYINDESVPYDYHIIDGQELILADEETIYCFYCALIARAKGWDRQKIRFYSADYLKQIMHEKRLRPSYEKKLKRIMRGKHLPRSALEK